MSTITSTSQRPFGRHQSISQLARAYPSNSPHQYRPRAHSRSYDQTYSSPTLVQLCYVVPGIERSLVSYHALVQPCYAAQVIERPPTLYLRLRAPQASVHFVLRTPRQFSQLDMPLSKVLRKLTNVGLLTLLAPRPLLQPILPQFRMNLHCAYHQEPRWTSMGDFSRGIGMEETKLYNANLIKHIASGKGIPLMPIGNLHFHFV